MHDKSPLARARETYVFLLQRMPHAAQPGDAALLKQTINILGLSPADVSSDFEVANDLRIHRELEQAKKENPNDTRRGIASVADLERQGMETNPRVFNIWPPDRTLN